MLRRPHAGQDVFVADVIQAAIYVIDRGGLHLFASGFSGKNNSPHNRPGPVAMAPDGTLHVSDASNVWRIARTQGRRR